LLVISHSKPPGRSQSRDRPESGSDSRSTCGRSRAPTWSY